jgi:zinc protease
LERVKTRAITDAIYERDSAFFQAMLIGVMATNGLDWRLKDTYVERLRAVTVEQIQAVANKYLVDDGLTVGVVTPAAGAPAAAPATATQATPTAAPAPAAAPPTPVAAPTTTPAAATPTSPAQATPAPP